MKATDRTGMQAEPKITRGEALLAAEEAQALADVLYAAAGNLGAVDVMGDKSLSIVALILGERISTAHAFLSDGAPSGSPPSWEGGLNGTRDCGG